MLYQFNTVVAVKPVDRDKWWIDGDIVKEKEIEAKSVNEALKKYVEIIADNPCYIEVSKTALKRKSKMFVDTKDGAKQVFKRMIIRGLKSTLICGWKYNK